jgi:hypothetical protein
LIYVDPMMNHGWTPKWARGQAVRNCHLFADADLEALHLLAQRVGMRRLWFQNEKVPHYDLVLSKRTAAVEQGAIEVSVAQAAHLFRAIRKSFPVDSERRVAALLEGTLAGLQKSNVQTSRQIVRVFHRVLELDPLAPDIFGRVQPACNCKDGHIGHSQMCPQRLNTYLQYLEDGDL